MGQQEPPPPAARRQATRAHGEAVTTGAYAPLWRGPDIAGPDQHFADPAVEAAYMASLVPANRMRLVFVITIMLAIATGNLTLDLLTPAAAFRGAHLPYHGTLTRCSVLAIGALLLWRARRAQTHQDVHRLALLCAVLWWTTRIASELVPDPAVYAGSGMTIGATALLYISLPLDARILIPGMAVFSASMVLAGVHSGILRGGELISTLIWLAAIQVMGGATLVTTRGSLRKSHAQGLAFEHLALHDPLTGLANRRGFERHLAAAWQNAAAAQAPISLISLDLDHFKLFNDHFGHLEGDAALRQTALALQSALADGACAARIGGEEFACVLPNADAAAAAAAAAAIAAALRAAGIAHPTSPTAPLLTASLGVATAEAPRGDSHAALFALADRLLYAAKQGGRARIAAGVLPAR